MSRKRHVNPMAISVPSAGARAMVPVAKRPMPAPGHDQSVSIVITTYNRPGTLLKAVNSVLRQHYPADKIEVVVVNDGGEDVGERLAGLKDARVRYFTKPNGGLASARNFGIDHAGGELIGFLDDDDWLLPDHVRVLELAIREEPCAIAYGNAEHVHQRRRGSELMEVGRERRYNQDWNDKMILLQNFIPVLCLLARREVFDGCRFDESFPVLEDWDWLIRVSRVYRLVHVARVTAIITEREDGSTMSSAGDAPFLVQPRRIFATYNREAAADPNLQQAREQRLLGYQTSIAAKAQQHFILSQIVASADPCGLARAMKPALTGLFTQVASGMQQQAMAAGDRESAELIGEILQAAA